MDFYYILCSVYCIAFLYTVDLIVYPLTWAAFVSLEQRNYLLT